MKYFLDTEFLEGTQNKNFLGFIYGKTKSTIDLISIGIVSEDGREYYAISKDFNLKEAWNRYDIKIEWYSIDESNQSTRDIKVYWIRDNVLKPIFIELRAKEVEEYNIAQRRNVVLDFPEYSFCFIEFKRLINKYGKTNKQIAEEIKDFISYKQFYKDTCQINLYQDSFYDLRIEDLKQRNMLPQFYGYYCDYDWVVLCWLFGRMIDLPKGFPMFAFDIQQQIEEYKIDKNQLLKEVPQVNCHNALQNAIWNKSAYNWIQNKINNGKYMTKYVIPKTLERPAKWGMGIVSNRAWLFQYRSCGQDLMVQLEASSLNDVLVLFATHYHQVDEIYEIAEVS